MTAPIRSEGVGDGVCLIAIDRPDRRNALDTACYAALSDAFAEADADDAVRAIVLTGTGGHFTAGNDLADFQAMPPDADHVPGIRFLASLSRVETPVLAAVEGNAIGVGTTLLLHCDLAYAGRSARFRAPFVQLGLTPEGASSLLLPALVGPKKAAEILLFGGFLSGSDAAALGLVNEAVEDGMALERALERARALAALPPDAVRATRRLLRRAGRAAIEEALALEEREFLARCRSDEARSAFAAFFRK